MVNSSDKQDFPAYSLDLVRSLAAEGKVVTSPTVLRDYENLGYGPDEVYECLTSLKEGDFDCSVKYGESARRLDVYKVRRMSPSGQLDDLYIKFELVKKLICVRLVSFHRERDI